MQQGADDPRTGTAEGMAQRDCAAVEVDLLIHRVEQAEVFQHGQGLGREGLVELPQVNVVYLEPGGETVDYQRSVDELPPQTAEIKIRIGARDWWPAEYLYGIPFSGVHTPAPFFDNVNVIAEVPDGT